MPDMPILETARLLVRTFVMEDLPDVHRLLDIKLHDAAFHAKKMESLTERAAWLQWSVLNYVQLARLYRPPYGDRAVVLKSSGQLVGACGFVPCLAPFERLPGFGPGDISGRLGRYTPEFGLFYAISPTYRHPGYASEAAQALVDFAFEHLHLKRVVATTDYDNAASVGVMRKLG